MYAEGTDGRITLAWMESLGLDAAAPVVGYNVAGQNRASVPVGTPIAAAEELAAIEKDGIYYLADDIVISGEWTSPVGFAGTLNGNGHGIVLDGATVTGGLFNQLDGALVRNLSIVEGDKANTLAPVVKPDPDDETKTITEPFGVLADTAWGVYENIVIDVDVDFSGNTASKVGGLFGQRANAGGLYLSGCVNHGSIHAGEAAGGMVAEISGSYNGWINRCINNGDLSHTNQNCGGMLGYMKFTKNQGSFRFLHNINSGAIADTKTSGSEAGIVGLRYIGCMQPSSTKPCCKPTVWRIPIRWWPTTSGRWTKCSACARRFTPMRESLATVSTSAMFRPAGTARGLWAWRMLPVRTT